jgi:hypothetical protein
VAAPGVAAGEIRISMDRGRVTLIATDAPLADVLAEWARVGGTLFAGAEAIGAGPRRHRSCDGTGGRRPRRCAGGGARPRAHGRAATVAQRRRGCRERAARRCASGPCRRVDTLPGHRRGPGLVAPAGALAA